MGRNWNGRGGGVMKKDIRELIIDRLEVDETIDDAKELYDRLNFDSSMDRIIESNIDTLHSDLSEWAVDNKHWIERTLEDGVCARDAGYYERIHAGQWLSLKADVQATVSSVYRELNGVAFNREVA
jgi:hypothetical protein